MTSLEIVGLVAIILISAFAVIAIIVAIPLFRLLNKVRFMADRLSESLIPMVEKLNDTVTHLNTEAGSLTDLTQSISSIVEQLEKYCDLPNSFDKRVEISAAFMFEVIEDLMKLIMIWQLMKRIRIRFKRVKVYL